MSYFKAILQGFPNVYVSVSGDETLYENITWEGGDPLPIKSVLDQWIIDHPNYETLPTPLTKLEFRKLFTLSERVIIDNAQTNPSISSENKAILFTMQKDMELATEIDLTNSDTIAGVNFLESLGLIATGRAEQVLSNTPPV